MWGQTPRPLQTNTALRELYDYNKNSTPLREGHNGAQILTDWILTTVEC